MGGQACRSPAVQWVYGGVPPSQTAMPTKRRGAEKPKAPAVAAPPPPAQTETDDEELFESAPEWFEEATDLGVQHPDYLNLRLGPVIPVQPMHLKPGMLAWYRTVRVDRHPDGPEPRLYYLIAPALTESTPRRGESPIANIDWVEFVHVEEVGGPGPGWILLHGAQRDSVFVHFARAVANDIAENSE